ncbi:MAG: hypothetical protein ACOCVF_03985 [bacterium]
MGKVWNERRLFTEEQIVTVQPDEMQEGVVLKIDEAADEKSECRLYLTYDEAKMLAKQLTDFVNDNCT